MLKKLITLICITATLVTAIIPETAIVMSVEASEESVINKDMKLWYDSPANINTRETNGGEWMQQSLPLGNGDMGNLIFGGIALERIHFNEKTLWTGGPSDSRPNYQFGNKSTAYTAQEIESYRQILDDKSTNVFNDLSNLGGYGMGASIRFPGENNMYKGSYQDFGDIWLDYSSMGMNDNNITDYRRELDMQTGIAATTFTYGGVRYTREHFVSYPDCAMVTNLTASEKEQLTVTVRMELNNNNLSGTVSQNTNNHSITINGYVKDNGLKFRTTMKVIPVGGSITANTSDQSYTVKDADSIMLIMTAETDYKNDYPTYRDAEKNLTEEVDGRVAMLSQKTYQELKDAHVKDHQELFDRVSLKLGDALIDIPTNELVEEYRQGNYSTYLEVLAFQFGRYLTIAGSRGDLPSNLVGLWTVGDSAWTGDYHFNINVQMNYWPVYVTNLAECGTTMVEYMDNLREPGRLTAERVHGITNATKNKNGFTVHTENNPFGMTAPTNAQEYGWNPTGAAWAIQNLWAHYEFTENTEYLRNTIYPIMKEAALFWDQYLWTSDYQIIHDEASPYNGQKRVVVAPSFSEEQGPTAVGTTYDQSLVWELYKECIEAGKILGEDEALLQQWTETMQKLDPIEINATNGIKEWYEETRVGTESGHNKSYAQAGNLAEIAVPNSGWNIGHPGEQRHASHLVGLYPGTLINKDNKEYLSAAIQSLTERGEYSTGWSKANKINLWARTGNGEMAYRLLNNLIGGNASGLQYNLFDSHGSGGDETMKNGNPVWQIDGNYGLTSGVAEMLLQSQLDYVQFLPAIPDAWEEGEVQGLKARGNFTIGESWFMGMAETFTVCYEGEEEEHLFVGEYENITDAKVTVDGQNVEITKNLENGQISFMAKRGKTYVIDMSGTNTEALKVFANRYLMKIDEDLSAVYEELEVAIGESSSELGSVLKKAKWINEMYPSVSDALESVYYLTTKDGYTETEIDILYVKLRNIYTSMLQNTEEYSYYEQVEDELLTIVEDMQRIMKKREILFSKAEGLLSASELPLTLSSKASDTYQIRYTMDGSLPDQDDAIYKDPLFLSLEGTTIIKAALFDGENRISKVYTGRYTVSGLEISQVESSHIPTWGSQYSLEKMIDGDLSTRWASKAPSASTPLELILRFNEKMPITHLYFDIFVSQNNAIESFEIQALKNGSYDTIYIGEKMGDLNDKVGEIDPVSWGYHANHLAQFDEVNTDTIKIILKEGFIGEPSIYEVIPFYLGTEPQESVDASELESLIAIAEKIDRDTPEYQAVNMELRLAFEQIILDAKEVLQSSQEIIDSRTAFFKNRYQRLNITPDESPDKPVTPAPENPFRFDDVQDSRVYYYEPVYWAYENSITTGVTDTTFAPDADVIRADMVTFLWRAAGKPKAESTVCTFTDVDQGAYYYDAMLWAVEEGITQGYNPATFGTTDTCTRAQMVTFLWRMKESEAPKTKECLFKDVVEGEYYYSAVLWAVENGITTGVNDTTFAPDNICTRGQAVTFISRIMK